MQYKIGAFVLFLLGLFACNSEPSAPDKPSILSSELVNHLPATTLGFYLWQAEPENSGTEDGVKANYRTPFTAEALASILSTLAPIRTDTSSLSNFVDAFRRAGLIPATREEPSPVKEGVIFIASSETTKEPFWGMLLISDGATNFVDKLSAMEAILSGFGFSTKTESSGLSSRPSFLINLMPSATERTLLKRLYFAADKTLLVASSSLEHVNPLFGVKQGSSLLAQLAKDPDFSRIKRTLAVFAPENSFGYISLRGLGQLLQQSRYSKSHEELLNEVVLLPLASLAFASSKTPSGSKTIAATFQTQDKEYERLLALLGAPGIKDAITRPPAEVAWALEISGALLSQLFETFLSEVSAERFTLTKAALNYLLTARKVNFGITPPESYGSNHNFYLALEYQNSAEPHTKQVQNLLDTLSEGGDRRWVEQTIAGTKAYISSVAPKTRFIVGAAGNVLIVATDDTAFKLSTQAFQGQERAYNNFVDTALRERLESHPPLAVIYGTPHLIFNILGIAQGESSFFQKFFVNTDPQDENKLFITKIWFNENTLAIRSEPTSGNSAAQNSKKSSGIFSFFE